MNIIPERVNTSEIDVLRLLILRSASGRWITWGDIKGSIKRKQWTLGNDRLRYALNQSVEMGLLMRKMIDRKSYGFQTTQAGIDLLNEIREIVR
jgi:hypothetical protein